MSTSRELDFQAEAIPSARARKWKHARLLKNRKEANVAGE